MKTNQGNDNTTRNYCTNSWLVRLYGVPLASTNIGIPYVPMYLCYKLNIDRIYRIF